MSESENADQDEPKIIVDTDWKEQVAREKQQVGEADASTDEDSPTDADSDPDGDSDVDSDGDEFLTVDSRIDDIGAGDSRRDDQSDGEMPPPPAASFDVLVSMLFTQSMALLGQMPEAASGKTTVNKPYAKHYIDTLDMLSEKTEGNLSDDERKMLSEALHALRMMYVNVKA